MCLVKYDASQRGNGWKSGKDEECHTSEPRYSGAWVVAGFIPGTEAICSHYLRILFPQVIRGGLASERFVHGKINLIIKNTCVYSQNVCHSFDVINM